MIRRSDGLAEAIFAITGTHGHVLWDWNGTLVDDVDHCVEVVNHLLDSHAMPMTSKQRYREVFEFPVVNYYERLGFDFTKEPFADLCHRFLERYMMGLRDLPLVAGMDSVLRSLQARGIQQSVLSASAQSDLDVMMDHFQLGHVFSHVFGIQDRMAASKVERGQELLRVTRSSPENTVLVGDTLHDLEVAERLGIRSILVSHGHQTAERLRARHHHVI